MRRLAIWSAQDLFRRKPTCWCRSLGSTASFILSSRTLLRTLPCVDRSMMPRYLLQSLTSPFLAAWWWFRLSIGPVRPPSPRSYWRGCIACWQLSLCLLWWFVLVLQPSYSSESWWPSLSLPLRVCRSWWAVLSLRRGCLVMSQGWGGSAVPWSLLPIVSAVRWLLSVGSRSCSSLACLSAGICPSASWTPGTGPSDSPVRLLSLLV